MRALKSERELRQNQEKENKLIGARKAVLELLVQERTSELKEQNEKLKEAGVDSALQMRGSLEEGLAWIRHHGFFGPKGIGKVVLKRRKSGGTEGVHICNSEDEVREKFLENTSN
jgi:hypothetical protein